MLKWFRYGAVPSSPTVTYRRCLSIPSKEPTRLILVTADLPDTRAIITSISADDIINNASNGILVPDTGNLKRAMWYFE